MRKQYLRPSQIITTFGPGSIVDLPDDSVMIAGIGAWDYTGRTLEKAKISEPRLQAVLKIKHPPAKPEVLGT